MSRLHPGPSRAPAASPETLFDDPALAEALAACASGGRLSNSDVRALRARRRAAATSVTLLLVAGIVTLSTVGRDPVEPPKVAYYATRMGEQRALRLADGSRLRLNGATRIAVLLAPDRREVRLDSGEAFFDVAHDAARPFSVRTVFSTTYVLGTAFDLDLRRSQVDLVVYRGAVRFGAPDRPRASVVVKAGWRSQVVAGAAAAPRRFDVSQQDWRTGWIDTDAMSLADLVEALNRRSGPIIMPPPAELAGIAVAGRFRLDEPVALLDAVGAAYGFATAHEAGRLRLVPRPRAS